MSRRPLVLLGLATASIVAAVAVWLAAFVIPGGGALDGRALVAFTGVDRPPLRPRILGVASLADPLPFAMWASGLIAIAVLRRRWLMAAVVPAILLSANLVTQQLKPALADMRIVDVRGEFALYPGSWPSGHSTASMSLALCLVLVVGPRLRPLAALVGAGYAIAVGYSLVVLGSHLPSDVLGGYLVAATFTLWGRRRWRSRSCAGLRRRRRRGRRRLPRAHSQSCRRRGWRCSRWLGPRRSQSCSPSPRRRRSRTSSTIPSPRLRASGSRYSGSR